MPYINTTMTKELTDSEIKTLTEAFGKAIEKIPGKTEEWLMLSFTGGARMAFRGDTDKDCCYIEVALLGSSTRDCYNALTAALTEEVSRLTGIDPGRIYVRIGETEHWGWQGGLF